MKVSQSKDYGVSPQTIEILEKKGYENFTKIQEEAIKAGLCKGKSFVIAAPTSSGKTTIAEIAGVEAALKGSKTVYLVSHKALAEEKYLEFKKSYDAAPESKWFSISIATGDRVEGEWNDGLLIATYEKYLALISSSIYYSVSNRVVVADEIQIMSDDSRGADIEILLSIMKSQSPLQFIALSATAPNASEIAGWLNCDVIKVKHRDVPLKQEIWFNKKRFSNYLGDENINEEPDISLVSDNTLQAVNNMIECGLGPVLVFTMTRPRAKELAENFYKGRQQEPDSYKIAEQLELFTEPTAISDTLKRTTERKVAFHSADLSYAERSVVEDAIRKKTLDVVFSTPTLANGVNLPIRTVIFDSFSRNWQPTDSWLNKSEYLNMSGRAGRLGLDPEGLSILIVRDRTQAQKANEYLAPEVPMINSKLFVTNRSIIYWTFA